MIGRVIDALTTKELRRVLDAPAEAWAAGAYRHLRAEGPACFVGHVLNIRGKWVQAYGEREREEATDREDKRIKAWRHRLHQRGVFAFSWDDEVEERFDNLCYRFSTARVVRAIKLRALRNLEKKARPRKRTVPSTIQREEVAIG